MFGTSGVSTNSRMSSIASCVRRASGFRRSSSWVAGCVTAGVADAAATFTGATRVTGAAGAAFAAGATGAAVTTRAMGAAAAVGGAAASGGVRAGAPGLTAAGAFGAAAAAGRGRAASATSDGAPSAPRSMMGTSPVSPALAMLPRSRTAIFCMTVRICGVTRRSVTPSPTDLMSARIITRPTNSPLGVRTGRKIARRPSSIPLSWLVCVVSLASASIASSTTVCSSGPSAPSLSHSMLASLSKIETEWSRIGGSAARNCHPKDSAVTGSAAAEDAGTVAGPVVGGRTAIAFCDCKDFPEGGGKKVPARMDSRVAVQRRGCRDFARVIYRDVCNHRQRVAVFVIFNMSYSPRALLRAVYGATQ